MTETNENVIVQEEGKLETEDLESHLKREMGKWEFEEAKLFFSGINPDAFGEALKTAPLTDKTITFALMGRDMDYLDFVNTIVHEKEIMEHFSDRSIEEIKEGVIDCAKSHKMFIQADCLNSEEEIMMALRKINWRKSIDYKLKTFYEELKRRTKENVAQISPIELKLEDAMKQFLNGSILLANYSFNQDERVIDMASDCIYKGLNTYLSAYDLESILTDIDEKVLPKPDFFSQPFDYNFAYHLFHFGQMINASEKIAEIQLRQGKNLEAACVFRYTFELAQKMRKAISNASYSDEGHVYKGMDEGKDPERVFSLMLDNYDYEAQKIILSCRYALVHSCVQIPNIKKAAEEAIELAHLLNGRKQGIMLGIEDYVPFELRIDQFSPHRFLESRPPLLNETIVDSDGKAHIPTYDTFKQVGMPPPIFSKERNSYVRHNRLRALSAICKNIEGSLETDEKTTQIISGQLRKSLQTIKIDPLFTPAYFRLRYIVDFLKEKGGDVKGYDNFVPMDIIVHIAETGNYNLVQLNKDAEHVFSEGGVVFVKVAKNTNLKECISSILRDYTQNPNIFMASEGFGMMLDGSGVTVSEMIVKNNRCAPSYSEILKGADAPSKRIYLERAIHSLCELQIAGNKAKSDGKLDGLVTDMDYLMTLEETVFRRLLIDASTKKQIIKVAENIKQMPKVLSHGDFHLGNILDRDENVATIVDFERVAYANRLFDLAYLLEQNELDLSETDKRELVDYFVHELNEKGETVTGDLQKEYAYNAAFVNLRIAGAYSRESKELRKESSAKYAEIYIQQAKNALERISNSNML